MNIHQRLSLLLAGRPAGQAAAQFAIVSALFLLALFGIIEMGTAVTQYNSVCTAAREAARYAIVHSPTSNNNPCPNSGNCPAVQAQALNYAPFLQTADVSATFTNPANATSDYALVSITHAYNVRLPLMHAVTLHLAATSKMLVSQ